MSRRTDAPARAVRLAPLALTGPGGSDVAVFGYRIVSSVELAPLPSPAPAPLSASLDPGDQLRRRDAQPSTY